MSKTINSILIADDDPMTRKVLGALAERGGFSPILAQNGLEALDTMSSEDHPSIVLLDWMMPKLSGPEVCDKIRQLQTNVRPYILMLSNRNDRMDIVTALDTGADDYLTKPFNANELLARLRVASRIIEYQHQLQNKDSKISSLSKKQELLEQLVIQGSVTPDYSQVLTVNEINASFVHTLSKLNLNPRLIPDVPLQDTLTAWTGFLIPSQALWCDFLIEVEYDKAIDLYRHIIKKPIDNAAPFLTEVSDLFKASLVNLLFSKGFEVLSPMDTTTKRDFSVTKHPQVITQCFALLNCTIKLTILQQCSPAVDKTSQYLHLYDVLASPFPKNDTPLINSGVILTPRFLEKVLSIAELKNDLVSVHCPSELSRLFHPILK